MRNKLWLALLCFLLSASFAHATQVKEITTPGGITAWLVEEHALPLLTVKVAFKEAGSAADPKGKEGLTSLMTDMLMQGAGGMDALAFQHAVEEKAICLAFEADEDVLVAQMESLSENKARAFELMGLALTQPRFDKEAVERSRARAISEIASFESNPNYVLERAWHKAAFGDHPYGHVKTGSAESIAAITLADLQEQKQRYYAKSNMLVAIVGDIDESTAASLLDASLGALPASANPRAPITETVLPAQGAQVNIVKDIPQTLIMLGTNAPKRDAAEYYAAYVLNHILGGGSLTSRMNEDIREKRGLAYYAYSELNPLLHAGTLQGVFATRNSEAKAALQVAKDTLRQLRDKGISEAELKIAKQYINGAFPLQLDSNVALANFLISMQMYHLGRDYLDKRAGYMQAVSVKEVNEEAKKRLDPDKMLIIVVGNPDDKKSAAPQPER